MIISFERLSSRTDAAGVSHPSGSPDAGTQYNPHVITNSVAVAPSSSRCGRPNSGGESRQLFIDERELLAGLLFFLVPVAAALIVLVSALFYAAFVL